MGYLNATRRDELGREARIIEIDPHRGPIIRWAFEAYATGNFSVATLRDGLIDRDIVTALRELITSEFDRLFATAKTERKARVTERDRLCDERTKLLQAHDAGPVPLDLLQTEHDDIARQIVLLDSRIKASEIEYDRARAHLDDCLALAGNAHAIYMSIDDSLRRIANQAFFERLTVTDDDAIDAEPGVPLDTLFDPEVQATALARQTAGGNRTDQIGNVAGLNNDALVPPTGFEPVTNGLEGRCSIH